MLLVKLYVTSSSVLSVGHLYSYRADSEVICRLPKFQMLNRTGETRTCAVKGRHVTSRVLPSWLNEATYLVRPTAGST